jgi:nicotinate phosphoribosyltransferase
VNARFHVASPEDILSGRVAEIQVLRGREVLHTIGQNPEVTVEVRASVLPLRWPWAVFAGLEEALSLLEGRGLSVHGLPEGSVFYPEEPVLAITGPYLSFAEVETALLGLLCQATGVATAAARCKRAAAGRPVYSFGARRAHPAVAPMIERAAFVGGCDGVSTLAGGELIGYAPVGTMSHTLMLVLGEEEAWRAFDRVVDGRVPRVAVVDTFQDEKFGAVAAAQILADRLAAVGIDSPASRRSDLLSVLREVRWELDARGYSGVKIFVSGGIDEDGILEVNRYADAYGVDGPIGNAPAVEFSLDVVEVNGQLRAKRGKLSGRKHVWVCPECANRGIAPAAARLGHCPRCGHRVRSVLGSLVAHGKRKGKAPSPRDVRDLAVEQVQRAPDPFLHES